MNKILITLLLAISLVTASCAHVKQAGDVAKQDAIDCMHQDLGQTFKEAGVSVLLFVIATIATGGTDWKADLSKIKDQYGPDALACAAKIAADMFKPSTYAPRTGAAIESAYDRAAETEAFFSNGRSFK